MEKQEIYQQITGTLEELGLGATGITPEASLLRDLGLDSLDLAEFIMMMEMKFDISLPFALIEQEGARIADLVSIIQHQINQHAAS